MKLSKKGITPSQIGVTLRDSHGVAQVSSISTRHGLTSSVCISHLSNPHTFRRLLQKFAMQCVFVCRHVK